MGSIRKMLDLLSRAGFEVRDVTGQTRIRGNPVTRDDPPPRWAIDQEMKKVKKSVDTSGTNVSLKRKAGRPRKVKRIGPRPRLRSSMFDLLKRLKRGDKNG